MFFQLKNKLTETHNIPKSLIKNFRVIGSPKNTFLLLFLLKYPYYFSNGRHQGGYRCKGTPKYI